MKTTSATVIVPPTESRVKNVQPRMAKAEVVVNVIDETEDGVEALTTLSLIDFARRRAGLKFSFIEAHTGVKASQMSGALNGHGAFNVSWLDKMPHEFWDEWLPLLNARYGRSPEDARAQRLHRLIRSIEQLILEVA